MESRIQKELEVEIKLMGENLKIDMAAVEEDFAAQLHDVTEKCNVLRKKEKVALSKTNLKSANVIEKLSTDLAYAQNRCVTII